MPGFLSESFPTPTGIPQGSPLSPIIFLLFNAPLIKALYVRQGLGNAETEASRWVDDAATVVISESYYANIQALGKAMDRANTWARRHAAKFAPDKFELVHFVNPREAQGTDSEEEEHPDIFDLAAAHPRGHAKLPLQINDQTTIQPKEHVKYLGVWLDQQLDFNTHRRKLLAKANGSLEALRGITGWTWGASLATMRKVYRAVVIPQMLYGLSAWYCPLARSLPAWELHRTANEFTRIQRRAAIMISGAFKSTSAAALNIELHLLPAKLLMNQMIQEAALRIQTGPAWARPECLQTH